MSTTAELIAAELVNHVDLFLWAREPATQSDFPGDARRDTGGIECSCGEWSHGPVDGLRPRAQWHEHVATAIQRSIATETVVETLNAVNQRLIVPRVGTSYMREMDRDIVTLRAAASALILLIGDADV